MVQRITISAGQYCSAASSGANDWIELTADQIHYLTRVLRLKVGEQFIALNGEGQQWLAAIGAPVEKAPVVREILADAERTIPPLRLVAALPKGNSFDQVVRQSTELGVTHICPVIAERTLLKPSDNKLARWRRIAAEASEQSERTVVPDIFEPMSFRRCVVSSPWQKQTDRQAAQEEEAQEEAQEATELRYLCAARAEDHKNILLLADLLAEYSKQPVEFSSEIIPAVTLAIGPEGGWTSDEITVAMENGYKVVSLGSAILRAVTAPLTALSLVQGTRNLLI